MNIYTKYLIKIQKYTKLSFERLIVKVIFIKFEEFILKLQFGKPFLCRYQLQKNPKML